MRIVSGFKHAVVRFHHCSPQLPVILLHGRIIDVYHGRPLLLDILHCTHEQDRVYVINCNQYNGTCNRAEHNCNYLT